MQGPREARAQLIEILRVRREQIGFRASIPVIMAIFFTNLLGLVPMVAWAGSYCALQVLELKMFPRARLDAGDERPVELRSALALLFLNGVVFGAASLMWAASVGSWGYACGGYLLAGSMLNVVFTTPGCKLAFRASIAPYLGYIAITPLFAIAHSGPGVAAALGLAGALMAYCALKLWAQSSKTRNSETSAHAELARRVTQQQEAALALERALGHAEAANAAKSTFLATMSHEIRTPLNGVLGMAQAMSGDTLSERQRDRLNVIRESGEGLLAILNDVLDLSKIEAGKLELEEIDFDLEEVARGAYTAFTSLANRKGISFALDLGNAVGGYRGDPTRLRQILYNLISNALKFTESGEIRVTAANDGQALELRVADTGIGMSEETVARLFTSFGQADASTTRRFGGTGLGLAISLELAELMGGTIEVESALDDGSVFRVRLPLPRAANPTTVRRSTAAPATAEQLELRVLAAEDNTVNQLVLKTLLDQLGIDPVIVGNGALAVEAWESGDFDLVLMDVQMPVMDGPTAARTIREREAQTGRGRTPIIALTANVMSHQLAEYRCAGMDGHVAKPIEAGKLFAALQAALNDVPAPNEDSRRVDHRG